MISLETRVNYIYYLYQINNNHKEELLNKIEEYIEDEFSLTTNNSVEYLLTSDIIISKDIISEIYKTIYKKYNINCLKISYEYKERKRYNYFIEVIEYPNYKWLLNNNGDIIIYKRKVLIWNIIQNDIGVDFDIINIDDEIVKYKLISG